DKKKMSILFNEYIKIEKANENVMVSPPQLEPANIRAEGKRVKIDLYDSLVANTTYTIDFGDAIVDNNEGNPMGFFTYTFSTGDVIDTMEVAGTVINAEDLEPIKGILVGLYPADSAFHDSVFRTKPFARVARTNGSGRFVVKGVKPGNYRVFALDDKDGDMRFTQKSERIAFDTTVITTTQVADVRMDTIWRDSTHYDSIRVVPYTHYLPDDIILKAFLEEGQDHHLLKTERPDPDHFLLYFTAPSDTLPVIRGINFDERCLVPQSTLHNDTIAYWVTDTTYSFHQDTLAFALTYMDTDTTGVLIPRTDTLELVPKVTHKRRRAEQDERIAEWEKDRARRAKKSKKPLPPERNPYLTIPLKITVKPTGTISPQENITFTASEPIEHVDTARTHFYIKQDSNWLPAPYLFLPLPHNTAQWRLYAEWESGRTYRFDIDSTAVRGVLGHVSKRMRQEIRVRSDKEFGSIFVHVITPDTGVVVQLLQRTGKVFTEQRADKGGHADFYFLAPGNYYLRAFIDRNGNNRWDTGEYETHTTPEEVFYFPRPLVLRAQWDMEQEWDLRGIPITRQKPTELTKQKADKKKTIKQRNKERKEKKGGQ
ncbi:MAG: Ig-like domain-containing protein, partial [Bacteroidaceae bacterium]|nr:Ig-like domain-containing protein [Bacteroidaceae bacterium]